MLKNLTGGVIVIRGAGEGGNRRDAVHFAVIYSDSPKAFRGDKLLIPAEGWWMDPNAFYLRSGPYDSPSLRALPAERKKISIPYMLPDGTKVPADTKVIWPYVCSTTPIDLGNPHTGDEGLTGRRGGIGRRR
mgnify:FL=1